MNNETFLLAAIQAAVKAGEGILEVYHSADFKIEEKADKSPLTLADRRSHETIMDSLAKFKMPILSEEGKDIPFDQRSQWDAYWLIDPLDGTKEFIKKNGEFTVNIAIIRARRPIAGVVYLPDKDGLYFASGKIGSYRVKDFRRTGFLKGLTDANGRLFAMSDSDAGRKLQDLIALSDKLPVSKAAGRPFTIVGSRSHATPELEAFVEEKRREYGQVEFVSAGSSLKLCLVAEGRADIYPRTGPTMEWDTAAGQAIAEFSGAMVFKYDTEEPLDYNKENLLNPWFVVVR
jgi:3'(2'), 5'-bisphosphate nucleotidase